MIDARQFNIRDRDGRLLCPACGFPGFANQEAYDERGGLIGTAICPCCLWEPGFDDLRGSSKSVKETVLASVRAYRAHWDEEVPWLGREENKPVAWNGRTQLAHLFEIAPNVR
jgi:hypothetical protein